MRLLAKLAALALTLFCSSVSIAGTLFGQVVGVTDGDTIKVLDDQRTQHKIRLAGIDAPEKAQAFGQRSKEQLASLVFDKYVKVETEKQDRYGRTVGKVVLDERDVNLIMVLTGFAWHYKKYEDEQSFADRMLYADAEREARLEHRGLWVESGAVAPWEWRKNKRAVEIP